MQKIFKLLIIIAIAAAGCTQNITLDLPSYKNKVAVYCLLSPGAQPKMYLNLSKSYYEYGDTGTGYRFIKKASVVITDQTNNTKDTLKLDSAIEGAQATQTWFYVGKHTVNAGHHYFANILYNGNKVTAETTVPMPVTVDHFTYKKFKDTINFSAGVEFQIFFNDKAGEANSYVLSASSDQTGNVLKRGFSYTSDQGFDGKQMELLYDDYGFRNPNDTFTVGFTIDNATQATGRYFTDLYGQFNNYQDPFSEPVIIESNVNGGLGIFGAITPSKEFYIKVR